MTREYTNLSHVPCDSRLSWVITGQPRAGEGTQVDVEEVQEGNLLYVLMSGQNTIWY